MDRIILHRARELTIKVIKQAGKLAKDKFDMLEEITMKDNTGDVVTEVDYLCEHIILSAIQEEFPEHQVHSEEAGWNGNSSDWLWMIDPLDGTNNYAVGLPLFSISITLLYKRDPVIGVIYEPITDRLYVAVVDEGAYCNGKRIRMRHNSNFSRSQIGWIQGHRVQHEERAAGLRRHIDRSCKRMMRLWAPTLQWCMLAKGDIDGIVLYNSEGDDLYSGLLMVKEAGGVVIDYDGQPFEGMNESPYLIACHPSHQEELIAIVNEGLKVTVT